MRGDCRIVVLLGVRVWNRDSSSSIVDFVLSYFSVDNSTLPLYTEESTERGRCKLLI